MVYLIVQFKQKGVTVAEAKSVNEVMVPMIDAKPGFISKMWLGNDDTGEFAGVYQFDTKENAEAYVKSDVIAFLKSLPTLDGELTCKIYELYREQAATSRS
ncbi:MAG: YdhR family protein [Dehalococcoidia bacterium]|nr:MAG: YdhR family protein [Dehalococcoidia bacterium]